MCRQTGLKMKVLSIAVSLIVVISSPKCAAVTPVRLVDGPHPFAGRLEVFYQGEWGSICETYFDNDDADVVCGMIRNSSRGFVNATILHNGYYGRSNGPVMITRLDCSGTEEDIFFCKSDKWKSGYCPYNRENVAIDCNTQVRLINSGYGMARVEMLINHRWATVCNSNFGTDEAEVLCRTMGLSSRNATYNWYGYGYGPAYVLNCDGTETDVSECSISDGAYHYCDHSRDVQIECGDTGIRLANGRTELQGKLEVEYRGRWLEFCPEGFGPNEARVACRMISNGTNEISGTIGLQYRSSSRYFYNVNHLKCNGNESDLSQCSSSPWGYSWCSSSYVVTLDCNSVRLTDGESSSYYQMGRVEVSSENGTWGTVCDDSFDNNDARVICRMLGFNGAAQAYNEVSGRFPHGHGAIIIDDLNCRGYENDISECSSRPWFTHNCGHSEDAGVACFDYGYSTRVPYFPTATAQTEVSLRLVNGGYHSGRVEVYYHGQWGTVCDSNFDHNDVQVICRSLGWNRGSSYGVAYYGAQFGEGEGNVIIEDLDCNGNEYHLSQCRSKTWMSNGCDHSRDVGVDCNAYRYDRYTTQRYDVISNGEYEGAIRLVNGNGRTSGRVEVFYNGQWGTVCDDYFDWRDAQVICRNLGLYYGNGYAVAYTNAFYGQGSGPVMISNLDCSGGEWGLSQCPSLPWLSNTCGHYEDAGVDCYGIRTTYPWWIHNTYRYEVTTNKPQVTLDEIIHVNCNQNGWDIRVDMYKLRELYPNSKASDIYLGENTCTGSENWRYLTFHQGLRECLTSETIGHDALVYRNELVYAERDPMYQFIIRSYKWTVAIECDVQRNETSSGHLHHDNRHSQEPQISGSSHFTINMSFYSDPNFLNRISGNPLQVSVGDKVYVKVYTTTPDWSVKMRVHTCYAKPSQYSSDNMKFYLIRNGCEVDANTHLISQSAHETRFIFQDFEYTSNHEGIHVFCDAEFCESHDYSQQCQQTCNPIIRRRVHVEKLTAETTTVTNVDDTTIETNSDETTIV